jgi:hypothetical protein
MLRFQTPTNRQPRNYLARGEQYRLFALIVGVGAVFLVIKYLLGSQTAPPKPAPTIAARNQSADADQLKIAVDVQRLKAVKDNSDFQKSEADAWFYLFSLLPNDELSPRDEVTYTQLIDQPHVYRGQLVTVRGEVVRIDELPAGENDQGIDNLYRILIRPPGRALWPITAYCLELPETWTTGKPLSNQVLVTGFFFKNLSYAWQDGMGLTPVLVARSFSVLEQTEPEVLADGDSTPPLGILLLTAAGIAAAVVLFIIWRTAAPENSPQPKDDPRQIGESLQRLAREGE